MNKQTIISSVALVLALCAIVGYFFLPRATAPSYGGGVGFASFGEAGASSTLVSVATGTQTVILAADPHRTSVIICNALTQPVTLSMNTGTAYGVGIVLNPQASSTNVCKNWEYPSVPVGAIYGMATGTTGQVGVLRGDGN